MRGLLAVYSVAARTRCGTGTPRSDTMQCRWCWYWCWWGKGYPAALSEGPVCKKEMKGRRGDANSHTHTQQHHRPSPRRYAPAWPGLHMAHPASPSRKDPLVLALPLALALHLPVPPHHSPVSSEPSRHLHRTGSIRSDESPHLTFQSERVREASAFAFASFPAKRKDLLDQLGWSGEAPVADDIDGRQSSTRSYYLQPHQGVKICTTHTMLPAHVVALASKTACLVADVGGRDTRTPSSSKRMPCSAPATGISPFSTNVILGFHGGCTFVQQRRRHTALQRHV